MKRVVAVLAIVLAACGGDVVPPVEVSGFRVLAPLPGATASVAYFTIANNTDEDISIVSIDSPQFGSAMLHRSLIEDGVARMRHVDRIDVPSNAFITLEEGGLHVMLERPAEGIAIGDAVTLVIALSTGSDIILKSSMQSRVIFEEDESS